MIIMWEIVMIFKMNYRVLCFLRALNPLKPRHSSPPKRRESSGGA